MALLEFLWEHEHDWVLDAAAMARLNGELMPAALQAWPQLQDMLETTAAVVVTRRGRRGVAVYPWTARQGFWQPLDHEQVFALTQQLMLQVKRQPVFLFALC